MNSRVSFRSRRVRRGYSMLEIVVCMTSATVLLVGMSSSVYIATQAFDGKASTQLRSEASAIQSDMLDDLSHATGFTTRNNSTATFTVPDRNGDGVEETIKYQWNGNPNYQLTYSINGGTGIPVLDNVQAFQFQFASRNLNGVSPPPGAVDSSLWGNRWRVTGTFGYTTKGLLSQSNNSKYILCRYTLSETARVRSISCYFTSSGNSDVRCAIYAANTSNVPTTRLVQSAAIEVTATGWATFDVPVTTLNPGEYFLAVSYKRTDLSHAYELLGGAGYVKNGDATNTSGFPSSWSGGTGSLQKVSIYANYDVP